MGRPSVIEDLWRAEHALAQQGTGGRIAPTHAVIKFYRHDALSSPLYVAAELVANSPTTYVMKKKATFADICNSITSVEADNILLDAIYACGATHSLATLGDSSNLAAVFAGASGNYTPALCTFATNSTGFGVPVFTGSGLNDLTDEVETAQSLATDLSVKIQVKIDTLAATDKFSWREYSAGSWGSWTTGVSCAVTQTVLAGHIAVKFGAITGHTLNDLWEFAVGGRIYVEPGQSVNVLVSNETLDVSVP